MSTAPPHRRTSLKDYLEWEERSGAKHEFYQGQIFAMAGASPRHNRIAGNIFARLHQLLEGTPCEPFASDQRIRIEAVDLSTYPDVSIVCGGLELAADDVRAIKNPRVLIEVLSKSTENYDRGPKFELYQHLDSFQEYLLVSQEEARITQYVRQDDGTWRYKLLVGPAETLAIESLHVRLPFAAIYRNVEFGPEVVPPAAQAESP
jgi:Uma2 family endonuclease